ncbi:unnamed protein product [Adineta ricciae]|uniref:Uncharacterized protein n=1 Tax=Adineta ricciae TaxID=249248 RepID=A0A815ICV6_ADIRI|nr:unnamed protein product [Adineta ricciae]CAF1598797.1 unnamed protein product [Adineta ricciae]
MRISIKMNRRYFTMLALLSLVVIASTMSIKPDEQVKGGCPQAEKVCRGFGGGDLCNSRCRQCGYSRGACGGFGWQTCQCL